MFHIIPEGNGDKEPSVLLLLIHERSLAKTDEGIAAWEIYREMGGDMYTST